MMKNPLTVNAEGWIVMPEAPGMGYELNEEKLAATKI